MCLLGCGNFSALNCTSWVYDIDEERCRHLSWFKKHAIPLITLFALGFPCNKELTCANNVKS